MIRYLPFTGVEENTQILTNTQTAIPTALENNPTTDLTKNMGKECSDEQIYGIPTQNPTLERIGRQPKNIDLLLMI